MLEGDVQSDPVLLDCRGLGMSRQIEVWEVETSCPRLFWVMIIFSNLRMKEPYKRVNANVDCGLTLQGLYFPTFPPSISVPLCAPTMQTTGKRQFSLICGSPEPGSGPWNEFISPQCDANEWFYSNITPCHNQLCILKREEMRRSVCRSTRQWLAIQMDGRDPRRKKKKNIIPCSSALAVQGIPFCCYKLFYNDKICLVPLIDSILSFLLHRIFNQQAPLSLKQSVITWLNNRRAQTANFCSKHHGIELQEVVILPLKKWDTPPRAQHDVSSLRSHT